MSDIKLKIWNPIKKRMYEEDKLEKLLSKKVIFINLSYGKLIAYSYDKNGDYYELIPLQLTGLHDKNGKEICQGDIVYFEYDYPGTTDGKEREKRRRIGVVAWQKFRATWAIKTSPYGNNDLFRYVQGYGVEVAGNIHSNPELLRKEATA